MALIIKMSNFRDTRVLSLLCLLIASSCANALKSSDPISSIVEEGAAARASEVFHSKWEYLRQATSVEPGRSSSALLGGPRTTGTEELESCEEVYGFFPCSTTFGGNLFLLIVFGYMLLKAAQFLSSGSELLLTVLNPGIIGGLLLPILGALPDALLILVSGLSASAAEAQSEVLVGMGLLAGSNIMLLTVLWGGCLLLGRCDLILKRPGVLVAKDKTLSKNWSLAGTGVTTDQQTRVASWIMVVTVLPYLVAQAPVVFGWSDRLGSIFVLVSCVISVIGLASYCIYQVTFPWIQQRWIYRAKEKVRRSWALHRFSVLSAEQSFGNLISGGKPNDRALRKIHTYFDLNKDNYLSVRELKGLIIGLRITHAGKLPDEDEVKQWLEDFDVTHDQKISSEEFVDGMGIWIDSILKQSKAPGKTQTMHEQSDSNGTSELGPHIFWSNHYDRAHSTLSTLLEDEGEDNDENENEDRRTTKAETIATAVGYLILGALVAGVVAEPLVDAVGNFSAVTGISPFFISFVATPLATNSSEAISSLMFARRKKRKNISMTYSQIYGGVTMNNTLCLAIFLAIVYIRGLVWDFSSEVLVILVATVVIGALASVRVTFPSWMAIVALVLYPFSIALVAVLDYVYGWQ